MKAKMILTRLSAIAALCGVMTSACGQIVLQPGETFAYEFVSLPLVGTSSLGPQCSVAVFYLGGGFKYEMFENSITETPFFEVLASSSTESTASSAGITAHWQDLQGAVRFTASPGGTVIIDHFLVTAYVPQGVDSYEYGITVVPEPSTLALLTLGGLGVLYNLRRKPIAA